MNVARVTEISAESATSFDDAVKVGIERAAKTLRGIEGVWIKDQTVSVEDDRIKAYRVKMEITFLLDG